MIASSVLNSDDANSASVEQEPLIASQSADSGTSRSLSSENLHAESPLASLDDDVNPIAAVATEIDMKMESSAAAAEQDADDEADDDVGVNSQAQHGQTSEAGGLADNEMSVSLHFVCYFRFIVNTYCTKTSKLILKRIELKKDLLINSSSIENQDISLLLKLCIKISYY